MVVTKDNLKQTETKDYPLENKKEKIDKYLPWAAYPYNERVVLDYVAQGQCLPMVSNSFPMGGWKNEKKIMDDNWWK